MRWPKLKQTSKQRKMSTLAANPMHHIHLRHLPRFEVRRQPELLIRKALRGPPGPIRPGHIKGLASRKAVDRAMQKTTRILGTKRSLKKPLQFALKAAKFVTHVGIRAVTMAYRAARAFFER